MVRIHLAVLGLYQDRGQTGASLVVGDDLEGKYIGQANAGVNTVNKTTSSKVKQAGAVEISAVSIVNTKDNTSVFAVGIPLGSRGEGRRVRRDCRREQAQLPMAEL
ncbi:MAG: hypothetical protein ACLS3M_08890 [Collinsella sp.]